jgi:hypothetical protein
MSATPDENIMRLIKPDIVEIKQSSPYYVENNEVVAETVE